MHQTNKEKQKSTGVVTTAGMLFTGILLTMATDSFAAQGSDDIGATLLHHIMDSHTWQPLPFFKPLQIHDLTIGPVTIPFTEYILMLLINAAVLIGVFAGIFHKVRTIPSKAGMLLEPLIFLYVIHLSIRQWEKKREKSGSHFCTRSFSSSCLRIFSV